jgi:hypothetical protein
VRLRTGSPEGVKEPTVTTMLLIRVDIGRTFNKQTFWYGPVLQRNGMPGEEGDDGIGQSDE